jgi:hypothetical protein
VIVAAVLFYGGAAVVLRVKRRRPPRWMTNAARTTEVMLSVIVWLVFFLAFVLRAMQWCFFGALAVSWQLRWWCTALERPGCRRGRPRDDDVAQASKVDAREIPGRGCVGAELVAPAERSDHPRGERS